MLGTRNDPDGLTQAGLTLGGKRISAGDAGVQIPALPRVPLQYILWKHDEEFLPHLTIAFNASVKEHLPLDVIWLLVHVVSLRLARAAPKQK